MSTPIENSNNTPQQTVAIASPVQEKIVTCCICVANIVDTNERLLCPNKKCQKLTCVNCANTMIEMMFGQPTLNFPLKCGACRQELDRIQVEQAIIKGEYYEQYIACVLPLYWSDDCLKEHEQLAQCPFCPYLEIHTTDTCSIQFLTCQNPACGKRSCLICLHAIDDDSDGCAHQSGCSELQSYKQMIEQAIELGSLRQCPDCHLKGIKDNNCTHMVCQRCGTSWCYFCGMYEDECDVDNNRDRTLSAHNQGWESNEKRCPMDLLDIHTVDDRWPTSDEECLEYFHRCRNMCELYNVLNTIGEDMLYELNNTFGIIDATGYKIDEIKDDENRILIKYPPNDEDT